MFNRSVTSLLLLLLLCPLISAQQETKEAISKLVGDNEKAWIYERFEKYMGNVNKCKRGESWTFYQGGRVVIKRCERDRILIEERRWSLEKKSSIDIALKVGDGEYLLLFAPLRPRSNIEKMILRQKADVKTAATKDLLFYHEVD